LLKVVAAEFVSDDTPDKVIAYYDKELQRYGKPSNATLPGAAARGNGKRQGHNV